MKARNKRYAAILSVVTVLALALSLVAVPVPSFAATVVSSPFSDVTTSTSYSTAISFLASQGVVGGYPDGTFKPNNTITRAEMAKILVELSGNDAAAQALANVTPQFKDNNTIPAWAWGYVNAAAGAHLILGYPDGTFGANKPVTRAEAFAMFVRLLGDDWTVTGNWPSNYVIAAANVGLTNGLQSVAASVPATRGEVAQLGYNAATSAKYTSINSTNTGTQNVLNPGGLYTKNTNAGGYPKLLTGVTVGNASLSSITLGSTPYALADKVTIIGAGTPLDLSGTVNAVINADGQVTYIEEAAPAASGTNTINDGTVTTVPTGFASLGYDGNSEGVYTTVYDSAGNTYILFKDGTAVQYDHSTTLTYNGGSTTYYVYQDLNKLVPGDKVAYTLQNGIAKTLDVTDITFPNALVQSTASNASNPTITITASDTNITPVVLPVATSTTITLNGKAASLGDLQQNDVVDVVVQNVPNGASLPSSPTVVSIAATRNTVSGTVTSVVYGSSNTRTITIQPSSGNAVTLTAASSLGSVQAGGAYTIALNGAGEAARILGGVTLTTPLILVKGTGQQWVNGAPQTVIVGDYQGTVTTYATTLANNLLPVVGSVYALHFDSQNRVDQATPVTTQQGTNDTVTVVSAGTTVVLRAVGQNGSPDNSFGPNGYLVLTSGVAYNKNNGYIGLSGLQVGDVVTVYSDSSNQYFAVFDTSR